MNSAPLQLSGKRAAVLFVAGGVGGALCDQIHVQGGVLAYSRPDLLGQAWWVGPLFGMATLVMYVATWVWVGRSERAQPGPVTRRDLLLHSAWFVGAYLASALLQHQPRLLALVYLLLFLRRLLRRRDAVWQVLNGVGLAVGGTSFEAVLASTGAFHYQHPDLWTVPLWLPGVYLHGAPLAMAVLRRLRQSDAGKMTV
ncbi:MAG: DUF2878 family protein [Deltaproteobacteria bacterium]|nr:DUF2878 family protein [Deltaproteobacteria bacterium]